MYTALVVETAISVLIREVSLIQSVLYRAVPLYVRTYVDVLSGSELSTIWCQ